MAWAKNMIDAKQSPSFIGEIPSYFEMLRWGNTIDEGGALPDIWRSNVEENLKYFDSIPDRVVSAHDMPDGKGKASIVVGASPILKDTFEPLKDIDRGRFVISCTNSIAEFLVENGVIPDYIFFVDGQQFDWTLNIGEENFNVPLVVSPFANSNVIKEWKGKFIVLPFKMKDETLAEDVESRWGKSIGQAGNAFNCAVATLVQCTDMRVFMFMGNELSFSDKYYVKNDSRNDESMYFFATDVMGKKVRTLIPLFQYKIWLEGLMVELAPTGYFFFNCSEGILGMDTRKRHMACVTPLLIKEAIEQTLKAFEFEDSPEMDRCTEFYNKLYATERYWPKNGAVNWISVADQMEEGNLKKLKKGLDVGTGHGFAVFEMVERGYDVYGADISNNEKSWKELGIVDRCVVAPAHDMPYKDNEFDFVVCSDVMEHVPESYIEKTLREIYRVGSDRYWFVIATGMDTTPKGLPTTHLTCAGLEFWASMIESVGYKITHASDQNHHVSIVAVKGEASADKD